MWGRREMLGEVREGRGVREGKKAVRGIWR